MVTSNFTITNVCIWNISFRRKFLFEKRSNCGRLYVWSIISNTNQSECSCITYIVYIFSHCSIGKDSPDAPTWKIWEPMLIEVWSILVLVLAFVIAQVSFIFGRPNRNKTKICLINQKLNEIESLNKKWQPTRQGLSMGGSLGLLLCVRV